MDAIKALLEKELSEHISPHDSYAVLDNSDLTSSQREALTKGEVLIKQIVAKGMHGDNKAITEILDRLYGKAPQHITQDHNIKSYHNFLEDLASLPDAEIVDAEIIEQKQLPKVSPKPPSTDGVSTDSSLLDDFGLL